MYTISFGYSMNDLFHPGGQAFLTRLREGTGHLFTAIRSLNEHGYGKGYMLQTTRTIRLSQAGVFHKYGVSNTGRSL
jgi:hypothetical protein